MGKPSLLDVPHDAVKKKLFTGIVNTGHSTSKVDKSIVDGVNSQS